MHIRKKQSFTQYGINSRDRQNQTLQYILQGALTVFSAVSILTVETESFLLPVLCHKATALLSAFFITAGILGIMSHSCISRILCLLGIALNVLVMWGKLIHDPLVSLLYSIPALAAVFYLLTVRLPANRTLSAELQLDRIYGSALALLLTALTAPLWASHFTGFSRVGFAGTTLTLLHLLRYRNLIAVHEKRRSDICYIVLTVTAAIACCRLPELSVLCTAILLLYFVHKRKYANWKFLRVSIQYPAQSLLLTFLALSTAGTLLLRTPAAMRTELPVIDAAFTAVSAACVTGLSTIDIAEDLTFTGKCILLLLIQLGGLGIMTLATLALHALGKLSLGQEQMVLAISNSGEQDLYQNLRLIVCFTFAMELIGAILLSLGFYSVCGNWAEALELGIFTSISAFCNAGFFPGPENLCPYAGHPLLLLIIAAQIISGGIAPAVTWAFLKKHSLKNIPFICKLVLTSSAVLLVAGTFFILLFEWNGILGNLPWYDKITNAFFYSASLRTAGFNTTGMNSLGFPCYSIMLLLMFIGGAPGGTAGGIKVTTAAVLFFAFKAALKNTESVTVCKHRIASHCVIQAVAIVISTLTVLFITVIMLTATQDTAPGPLLFEAVSALGTVGLSLGITGELDTIGRLIIILAMFIGRIGPLTLFLLLSEHRPGKQPGYPQAKIPLG